MQRSTSALHPSEENQRFVLTKGSKRVNVTQQYASLYFVRLVTLRAPALETAKSLWGDVPYHSTSLKPEDHTQRFVLSGTLYKLIKLRPLLLDRYTKSRISDPEEEQELETQEMIEEGVSSLLSEDDSLVLEDESGRISLVISEEARSRVQVDLLVHGLVLALLGIQNEKGEFVVEDLCFPGLAPQKPLKSLESADSWIAFVSGLDFAGARTDPLRTQLLSDYITGYLGSEEDCRFVASISHLIILGNLLNASAALEAVGDVFRLFQSVSYLLDIVVEVSSRRISSCKGKLTARSS